MFASCISTPLHQYKSVVPILRTCLPFEASSALIVMFNFALSVFALENAVVASYEDLFLKIKLTTALLGSVEVFVMFILTLSLPPLAFPRPPISLVYVLADVVDARFHWLPFKSMEPPTLKSPRTVENIMLSGPFEIILPSTKTDPFISSAPVVIFTAW